MVATGGWWWVARRQGERVRWKRRSVAGGSIERRVGFARGASACGRGSGFAPSEVRSGSAGGPASLRGRLVRCRADARVRSCGPRWAGLVPRTRARRFRGGMAASVQLAGRTRRAPRGRVWGSVACAAAVFGCQGRIGLNALVGRFRSARLSFSAGRSPPLPPHDPVPPYLTPSPSRRRSGRGACGRGRPWRPPTRPGRALPNEPRRRRSRPPSRSSPARGAAGGY